MGNADDEKTGVTRFRNRFFLVAVLCIPLPVILILFRTFVFQPFNMPSRSGEPNLEVGDYFVVSRYAYGYSRFSFPFNLVSFEGRTGSGRPQAGDIAVFKLPSNTKIDYVKRVIGIPDDHIQMISGVLNINGVPVRLEKVQLSPEFYEDTHVSYYRETLPSGRSYVVANMQDDGAADNTNEYIVPAGHYFALGDNRDNSEDSRFLDAVGYIPEENFIGPVAFKFWNSRGFSLDNRPEEIYPPK